MRTPFLVAVSLLIASLLYVTPARADRGTNSVELDIVALVPVGDFGDAYGLGIGGMLRSELRLGQNLRLGVRAGYIHHTEKNGFTGRNIPIWLGPKYYLGERVFLSGELGVNFLGGTDVDMEAKIGGVAGAGFEFGPLEARVGLYIGSFGDFVESLGLVASIGTRVFSF